MVNIFPFLSLGPDVSFWTDLPLAVDLWELRLHVVSKCTESFDIDRSSSSNIVAHILDQGFPNNYKLRLWLEWFEIGLGSLSGLVVLSWIFMTIFQDPVNDLFDIHWHFYFI